MPPDRGVHCTRDIVNSNTEYFVLAAICFLSAARYCAVIGCSLCGFAVGHKDCGVLVHFPSLAHLFVKDVTVLQNIHGWSFDPVASFVAYHQSLDIDRVCIEPPQC